MRCKLEKHLQYFQKNSVEQTLFQGLNGVIQCWFLKTTDNFLSPRDLK